MSGRVRIQAILKPFLCSSSFLPELKSNHRVTIAKHHRKHPGSTSTHFLSRGGTETGVSVVDGFIRGLASATSFPMLISYSAVCVVSFTYFSTPFTSRTQEAALETEIEPEFQYCNDLHDDKRKCSRLGQLSYSYESSLLLDISDRHAAAYILCINVPFRSVLLYQV